ncbi:hypothetical protein [Alcaligenes faecalis]|uniref:hypothetical protein n=1 Tax=Alcaligenes faecalis TaxID=511 RepID=UPI0034D4BD47
MSKEPLFWYRPRSDGGYEGPLHSGQIKDVRKASGAWVPLFAGEAPVSAEQVTVPHGWRLVPIDPTDEMLLAGDTHEYDAGIWWSLMLNAAPVTAPPDVTQQTLDDVKAGIPARDAEIDALRKEIETLQRAQAQPTFDDLQALAIKHGAWAPGYGPFAAELLATYGLAPEKQPHWVTGWLNAMNAVNAKAAQQPESGTDQFRDAAQMIEPSGNSGELNFQAEYEAFKDAAWNKSGSPIGLMDGKNAAWWAWVNRAALAQQDADKVDAERWRAFRNAVATWDVAFLERIEAYLRGEGHDNEGPILVEVVDTAIDSARKEHNNA